MKNLQQNQLAYTSERTLSKKSLYNVKSNPTACAVNVSLYLKKIHLSPVLLTPVVNLYFRIRNGPHGVIKGPGKTDS
jgi:hypothetical protein